MLCRKSGVFVLRLALVNELAAIVHPTIQDYEISFKQIAISC